MPKKYKHISLPAQLVGAASPYEVGGGRNIQELLPLSDTQTETRKADMARGIDRVRATQQNLESQDIGIDQSGYYELKLDLRRAANDKLFERFNIQPYLRYDVVHNVPENGTFKEYKEEFVYGRVSTVRLPDEDQSDFEKIESSLDQYIDENTLHSYFDTIKSIEPLTLEAVTEPRLLSELSNEHKSLIDIVFADDAETSNAKMEALRDSLGESFLIAVNSEAARYCRISVTKSELESISTKYKGIIEVTSAPLFQPSEGASASSEDIEPVDETNTDINPIIVADKPLHRDHPLISNVVDDQLGGTWNGTDNHATQVASLVVYGRHLPQNGQAKQKNRVVGLNASIFDPASGMTTLNELLLESTIQQYATADKPLIINLSMNFKNRYYERNPVHHVTAFLDMLANKYNCVITISAGNLEEINSFYANGTPYPDYYNDAHTTVLAPADSINNITVGAITYQESSESIARLENPSPITRRGFEDKHFGVIKQDMVHFDSNLKLDTNGLAEPEYNGPIVATGTNNTTHNIGTSFAAPLAAHELGILTASYPNYRAQTLKGLLLHSTKMPTNLPTSMQPERIRSLLGHGQSQLEEALNSLNTSSTIVIEDRIKVDTAKSVEFPVPSSLGGSRLNRLRLRMTLVYSPQPNRADSSNYIPMKITAQINRADGRQEGSSFTQNYLDGGHRRANVKKYPSVEKSTLQHTGEFWSIYIASVRCGTSLPDDYEQDYSLILTVEDINKDDGIDIHEEISQMIEVRTDVQVDIEVES